MASWLCGYLDRKHRLDRRRSHPCIRTLRNRSCAHLLPWIEFLVIFHELHKHVVWEWVAFDLQVNVLGNPTVEIGTAFEGDLQESITPPRSNYVLVSNPVELNFLPHLATALLLL